MKPHPARSRRIGVLALSLAFLCGQHAFAPGAFAPGALAQETAVVKLTLKNHRFEPAEPHAPAGKPFTIEVTNLDGTPAEFESKTLRVEKVVAAGSTITLQMRALAAGRYRFFDDYHEDTSEGFLVVQ
jgi:Cupredoxin-like domain